MVLDIETLKKEIDRLVEAGDQAALEQFVADHIAEFPEDAQEKYLFASYQEALEEKLADQRVTELQEKAIAAMDQIAAMKAELESGAPQQ